MQKGNLEVFLESVSIASACNKILVKSFLQPDTIGLIPTGVYTCNHNYSKKALIWLLQMEKIDGEKIMHSREFIVPEMPHYSGDGYCLETRTIYECYGCQWHGLTCQPFCDLITLNGDTLAERHERPMSRLEHITLAGYLVNV